MAARPSRQLQTMLQNSVQSVQWTYSLFWQLCPQQRMLVWGDGYYNGPIKTRKTVHPLMHVSAEEASLLRSQQLRELYESLAAGESPVRRHCAALSPEDLTESEWFYLMSASFSFSPGVGLPGKAYAKRHHIWLNVANEVDSKVFSRFILAKNACIETVVCIPLLDGVIELGTTQEVKENLGFIEHVKSFFIDHHAHPHTLQPPKPVLTERSLSNRTTPSPSGSSHFHTPSTPAATYENVYSSANDNHIDDSREEGEEESESEADQNTEGIAVAEPEELMERDMSTEDVRVGSPDDGSVNKLEHLFPSGDPPDHQRQAYFCWDESLSNSLQPPISGVPPLQQFPQEDTYYSHTPLSITHHLMSSPNSAFSHWPNPSNHHHHHHDTAGDTSQWLLKHILFTVPFLHHHQAYSDSTATMAAEQHNRHCREELNRRFLTLRSIVPFMSGTKMDKASVLGQTIMYVKELRKRIRELETRWMEMDQRSRLDVVGPQKMKRSGGVRVAEKRKLVAERGGLEVEVSIIERDVLVEMECPYRDGLLLDVMQVLQMFHLEITTVQSTLTDGVFVAHLRAKAKENAKEKKPSILEVKRAIHKIVPQTNMVV